jgi:hypothetical protein
MAMTAFTRNYTDNSTEAGFQFTFYCDLCQDGYKTQFIESQTYKKGSLLRGLSRGISIGASLLGAYRVGYGVERGADVLGEKFAGMSPEWHKEHERALKWPKRGSRHFHRCHKCRQWVCDSDFNEEEGLCVECAPRMNVEVVHARSQKMVEDIREKAANTTVFDGRIESKQITCPQCGKPSGQGKFCNNCGASLTQKKCPKCGTASPLETRFCGECGTRL